MITTPIAKKDFKVYPIFVAKQYIVNDGQVQYMCDDLICVPVRSADFAWNNGGTPVNMFNLQNMTYNVSDRTLSPIPPTLIGNGAVLFRPVLIAKSGLATYHILVYINYNTTTKQMIIYYYATDAPSPDSIPTITISQPPPGYCITKTSLTGPGDYAQVYPCSDGPAPVSSQYQYLFADRPISDKPTIYDNEIYISTGAEAWLAFMVSTYGYTGIPGSEVIRRYSFVFLAQPMLRNSYEYLIPFPNYQLYNLSSADYTIGYVPAVAPLSSHSRFFVGLGSMYWGVDDQNNLWFFAEGPAVNNGTPVGYMYQAMFYNRSNKVIYGVVILGNNTLPFSDSYFEIYDENDNYPNNVVAEIPDLGRTCVDTGDWFMVCKIPTVAIYNNEGTISKFTFGLDKDNYLTFAPASLSYNRITGTVVEIVEEVIYDSTINADEANNILNSYPSSVDPVDPNGLLSLDLPTVFMHPYPPDSPATYSIEVDSITQSGNTLTVSGKISSPSLSIFNGVRAYVMCGGTLVGSGEGQINSDGTYSVSVSVDIGSQNPSDCQVFVMATSRYFDAVTGQVPPLTFLVPIPSLSPIIQSNIAEPFVYTPLTISVSPSPTPTETPSPSPTPTEMPTPTPSASPSPSSTPTPAPSCRPFPQTNVDILDHILFCIGGYGFTVFDLFIVSAVLVALMKKMR